jgi:hypothetical protein
MVAMTLRDSTLANRARVQLLSTENLARVQLGGDARGRCAALLLPGVAGDGWGDGFAIY